MSCSDVVFETFEVLGTTLNEICYVKFEMAKSRCRAKAFFCCFFYFREDIENVMKKKGKPVLEFQSSEWMQDLAFMVYITQHLNNLKKLLRGRKRLVTVLHSITTTYHTCIQVEVVLVGDTVMTLLIFFV